MPYIDSDTVKSKRAAILAAFPRKAGWKVSVTKEHHSGIRVVFLDGPVPLTDRPDGYEQVNHYHIGRCAVSPEAATILGKAKDLAAAGNYTVVEDSDYGSIPKFYVEIHVGRWDRPYRVVSA